MKKIVQFYIILLSILLLPGCFSYAPTDNYPFAKVKELQQLNGTYNNLGISGRAHSDAPNRQIYYLSKIIWGNDNRINHQEIDAVQITAVDPPI